MNPDTCPFDLIFSYLLGQNSSNFYLCLLLGLFFNPSFLIFSHWYANTVLFLSFKKKKKMSWFHTPTPSPSFSCYPRSFLFLHSLKHCLGLLSLLHCSLLIPFEPPILFCSLLSHPICFIRFPIWVTKSLNPQSSSSLPNLQHSIQLITVFSLKYFLGLASRIPHLWYLLATSWMLPFSLLCWSL